MDRQQGAGRDHCLCGSGRMAAQCCLPLLAGRAVAQSAEALMRSRYTAFACGDTAYLLRSWHVSTRPPWLTLETGQKWIALEIKRHTVQDATHAQVEFVARYRVRGRGGRLHETSRFVRENGQWLYVNGEVRTG